MTGLALVLLLPLWQSTSSLPTLSDDDVEVVNAVIAATILPQHRRLTATALRDILMIDRTAPICVPKRPPARPPGCVSGIVFTRLSKPPRNSRRLFEQHIKTEVAAELAAAFARANAQSAAVQSDRIVGVRFVAPADWNPNVPNATVSRPAYAGENHAIIYASYSCSGGGCGHGWFVLLERNAGTWRVRESAMIWIS